MLVWINGELVPAEKAAVSVFDHGFLYGVGLFETMRVYNRKLFLWEEHYCRLRSGLTAFGLQERWTKEELGEAVAETVAANGFTDAYVRLSVTGGAEGIGLTGEVYAHPSCFIFVKEVPPLCEPPEARKLQTLSILRQPPEGERRFKSHNYVNNVLGRREIGASREVEGLFLTKEGYVCEGIVSNIFWWDGSVLRTPSADTGLLAGITRAHVISLAKRAGLRVEEGTYPLASLLGATEAFLTNSIQEIVPISEVNGTRLPQPYGAITRQLRKAYRQSVELYG